MDCIQGSLSEGMLKVVCEYVLVRKRKCSRGEMFLDLFTALRSVACMCRLKQKAHVIASVSSEQAALPCRVGGESACLEKVNREINLFYNQLS